MTLGKMFFAVAVAAASGAALTACTDKLNTQEAYKTCQQLQQSTPTFGDFNQCVECFETCSDCQPQGAAFACPGDKPATTSSGSGSGSSSGSSSSTGTGG